MANVKRGRGRPPKTDPNNPEMIQKRISEQIDKFGAKCADNLDQLFGVMYDVALKDKVNGEKPSMTNKVSAAKYCISFAQEYLDQHNADENGGIGDEKEEKQEDTSAKPLISLAYNGE